MLVGEEGGHGLLLIPLRYLIFDLLLLESQCRKLNTLMVHGLLELRQLLAILQIYIVARFIMLRLIYFLNMHLLLSFTVLVPLADALAFRVRLRLHNLIMYLTVLLLHVLCVVLFR